MSKKKIRSIVFSMMFLISCIFILIKNIKAGSDLTELFTIILFILFCIFVILYEIKDPRKTLYTKKEKEKHPLRETLENSRETFLKISKEAEEKETIEEHNR